MKPLNFLVAFLVFAAIIVFTTMFPWLRDLSIVVAATAAAIWVYKNVDIEVNI